MINPLDNLQLNITALIVAGGKGARMGAGENKLFLPLGDSVILGQTLALWQRIPQVTSIVVVCAPGEEQRAQAISEEENITKLTQIVTGGKERQHSVYQGLAYLRQSENPPDYVAVHDGARPFYDGAQFGGLLQTLLQAGEKAKGIITAIPVQDTIKTVGEGYTRGTLDRENLAAAQTPQLFHFAVLCHCYDQMMVEGTLCTDDAGVLAACGKPVLVFPGQKDNMKITTPEDYAYAKYLWQLKKKEGETTCG